MRVIRSSTVILSIILVVGALARLYRAGTYSFWYDEAYSLAEASDLSGIINGGNVGSDAPLYPLVLNLGGRVLAGEWQLRLTSVFFGVLTVWAIYMAARILLDMKVALAAAALAAVSPFFVYYSQELRPYTLLAFLTVCSLTSLWRAAADGGRRGWAWWAAYAVFSALGLYTHYFGFFTIAAGGVYFLFFSGAVRRLFRAFVISNVAALLAFLPWVAIFVARVGDVGSHYIGLKFSPSWVPLFLKTFIVGHHQVPRVLMLASLIAFLLLLLLSLRWLRDKPRQIAILACYAAVPFLLALIFTLAGTPIFVHRYLIGCAAALCILTAAGIVRAGVPLAAVACVVLAAGTAVSLAAIWDNGPVQELSLFRKKPYREMVEYIKSRSPDPDRDVVVHFDRSSFLPFCVYFQPSWRERNYRLSRQTEGLETALPSYGGKDTAPVKMEEACRSAGGVWLVMSSWTDDVNGGAAFDEEGREKTLRLFDPRMEDRSLRYLNGDFPNTGMFYFKLKKEPGER